MECFKILGVFSFAIVVANRIMLFGMVHDTLSVIWPDSWLLHIPGLDQAAAAHHTGAAVASHVAASGVSHALSCADLVTGFGHPLVHLNAAAKVATGKIITRSIIKMENKISKGEKLSVSDILDITKQECKLSALLASGFTLLDGGLDAFHYSLPSNDDILSLINHDHSGPKIATVVDHMTSHTMNAADKQKLIDVLNLTIRESIMLNKMHKAITNQQK